MAYEYAHSINSKVKSCEFSIKENENNDNFFNEKVKLHNEIDFPIRIGDRKIKITKNTKAYEIYKTMQIEERHKHKYSINPNTFKVFTNNDAKISATNENNNICEIFEIASHPFYLGAQYHPEYNVKPTQPENYLQVFYWLAKT